MPVWLWVSALAFVVYRFSIIIYNLYFHPLRHIPGPWNYKISYWPKYWRACIHGSYFKRVKDLHDEYGSVVRVGPNEVSCSTAQGWDDIYGSKAHPRLEFPKDPVFYNVNQVPLDDSVITASKDIHRQKRRQLAPAFTDKAIIEQEEILQGYVNEFIAALRDCSETNGGVTDIIEWYISATADILSDLAMGESFDCLKKRKLHPWIETMNTMAPFIGVLQVFLRYPVTRWLYSYVGRGEGLKTWVSSIQDVKAMATRRLEVGTERPDFMSLIWSEDPESKKSWNANEIAEFSQLLLFAGSETSATAMSHLTYWLLSNPRAYDTLVKEIRSIEKEEELTIRRTGTLEYLGACIDEGLRISPPVADVVPRIAPPGGDYVDGIFIPEGATVAVPQYATSHLSSNFAEPHVFIPERYLPSAASDPRFANDNKAASNPFSKGPRNCIGKKLAYTEMRMILSRMLWNFDLELQPQDADWATRKSHGSIVVWRKPPLHVKLIPVVRGPRSN